MSEIQTLANHLLNGLAYGLLLFILAAGLSLIFGMMDVINLSHGSFYLVGGFLGVGLVDDLGSWWLALAVSVGIVAVLGLITEISLLRPMYNRDHLDQILLTFGLALIIEDASEWLFGTTIQSMSYPSLFSGSAEFFGVVIPSYRLMVIFVGLLLAVALYLLLERTRIGSIIRAGVSDREMVSALGFNITAIFGGVFVSGLALAGLAGYRHPDPRRVLGPGLRDPHPHADHRGRRGLGQLDRRFLGEPAHRDNPDTRAGVLP